MVERLVKPGLETELVVGIGREPMGPTEPMGPAVDLEVAVRDGESAPPGDEVDVTGCSAGLPKTGLMPELGDEVLFARFGDCSADAAVGVCTTPSALAGPGVWAWDKPKGSTPRGKGLSRRWPRKEFRYRPGYQVAKRHQRNRPQERKRDYHCRTGLGVGE